MNDLIVKDNIKIEDLIYEIHGKQLIKLLKDILIDSQKGFVFKLQKKNTLFCSPKLGPQILIICQEVYPMLLQNKELQC